MIKRFLVNICGFDPVILSKEDIADLTFRRFALGFLLVILLSFLSTLIVFMNTIENIISSLLLALFFTLIIVNLYRLIIVTSSPNNLKIQKENFQDLIGHYIVKSVLLLMIFFIISEPLETFIFKKNVSYHLDEYKEVLVDNFKYKLESISNEQIEKLEYDYESKIEFNTINNLEIDPLGKEKLESKINLILEENEAKVSDLNSKIEQSNFFFQQISIVNSKVPLSYLLSILILLTVLYPVYLIMYDENFKKYFIVEEQSNNFIIKNNWIKYSKEQEEIFLSRTGKKLVRQNLFQDPPFNRIRSIDKTKYLKKGSLIKWFKKDY